MKARPVAPASRREKPSAAKKRNVSSSTARLEANFPTDRSPTGPTFALERTIEIQNRHPRLHVSVREVKRAIALLDAQFQILPADLRTFTPARRRELLASTASRGAAQKSTSGGNRQSKLPPGGCPSGELSIAFLTDGALAQIHADFMNDPTTTDVITFEGDRVAGLAGEICVSADTALAYAREHSRDFAAELMLYVVHGWLHLAGYDDLRPAKKRRMRAAEARAMKLLHNANAVPKFRLARQRRTSGPALGGSRSSGKLNDASHAAAARHTSHPSSNFHLSISTRRRIKTKCIRKPCILQ